MKNDELKCKAYIGSSPQGDSKNTVVFCYPDGVAECYDILNLYRIIEKASRLWEYKGAIDYKNPVFQLPYTNKIVDYITIGLALKCGFNTIYVGKKYQGEVYAEAIEPKPLLMTVNCGYPIPRSTYWTSNPVTIKREARQIRKGDLSLLSEDDFLDENWHFGLDPILNRLELKDQTSLLQQIGVLKVQISWLKKEGKEDLVKRSEEVLGQLQREVIMVKEAGQNLLFD